MATQMETGSSRSDISMARVALAIGVLSLIVWFGLAFAVSDVFYIVGFLLGLVGVVLGYMARKRAPSSTATAAIVVGAIPVVWFILYMLVEAVS
jgi:hypothetical protein